MEWLVLGAHISSNWSGCLELVLRQWWRTEGACPGWWQHPQVAARSARSHSCFQSVGCQEEYHWHRGAWYILHLFRWPVVGLVPAWWARWQWPLVRAAKQVVRLTYFPIGQLWVSGLCGCLAHVTFQD